MTRFSRSAVVFILACSLYFAVVPTTALGSETHEFDPNLSLTGGCTTSPTDPVADPGCPEGAHPLSAFVSPRSVTTDSYGDIYVASYGSDKAEGAEGRIDVFGSDGFFITEVSDSFGPKNLAVDSKGNLYVFEHRVGLGARVVRYSPSSYNPGGGEIKYFSTRETVLDPMAGFFSGIFVDRSNDHLFVHLGVQVDEFASAAEGNKLLEKFGEETLFSQGLGLAVDAAHGRIYASDSLPNPPGGYGIRVFELKAPHNLVETIEGSELPAGKFTSEPSIAVDEATGHVFAYLEAGGGSARVYEFAEDGKYLSTIEHEFKYVYGAEIGVDNGALSPNMSYLFVPSHPSGTGHSFAFGPKPPVGPPSVESVSFSEVTERDAELQATIDPEGLETQYALEYTTEESFEEEGFAGAQLAEQGTVPAGTVGVEVTASISGLSPGTAYVFRATATNEEGSEEESNRFRTYPAIEEFPACLNKALRTGLSALLPDCRAYELVTPVDTNARSPMGLGHFGIYFRSRQASPTGNMVSFFTEGGSVPGFEGTGSLGGDPYLASRGANGWATISTGPNGEESVAVLPGSASPDQGYSFWEANEGSMSVEGEPTNYVRYPDGHSALVGRGNVDNDPGAVGKLIAEGGDHIIFSSLMGLTEDAPAEGTVAIYDRTSDEVTHLVSLLPENTTPAGGENAFYRGASLDGKGVVFQFGGSVPSGPLYLRYENEKTYEVAGEATFTGVAEGGSRVFYLKGGDLFAFDVNQPEPLRFTEAGNVTPVNVSADGSAAYFVSPSVLTGMANPNGALAQPGKENLYVSREGTISFVGIVTERDVEGEFTGVEQVGGLGLWLNALDRPAVDPSRTTPDGSALLFESRADLTGYDPEGHAEVYRYDATGDKLTCLSCNPTLAPATGQASLQSISSERGKPEPLSSYSMANNLRSDGRRVFFQSSEALVQSDTDELQDVYEWEAEGVGSCARPEGCVYLISSGHSDRIDYLYGVSDSGDDVFFRSSDLLLGTDTDETPSIYDARVGGGFPEPAAPKICHDESCRSGPSAPPVLPETLTPIVGPGDNVPGQKQCSKGTRKVKRHGKIRCVKKHRHHHRRPDTQRKGAGK